MRLAKPLPPLEEEIENDLAANLAALGIEEVTEKRTHRDVIFDAMVALAKETKAPVTAPQVMERTKIQHRQVCDGLRSLWRAGRLFKFGSETRPSYLPKVV